MTFQSNAKVLIGAAAMVFAVTGTANATILTIFDDVAGGAANFDATVALAGGSVDTDVLSGMASGTSIDRGDYTITANDGGTMFIDSYGTLSGQSININPELNSGAPVPPSGSRGPASDYFDSGVTFTFDDAVNSIGFEVGDWATCCHNPVTELFISFDGGAAIKVASASSAAEGLFPSQADPSVDVFEAFVAAFDDSGDFTTVAFWGNGIGEFLTAGGQVKYALVDRDSLPPIPLPAGGLLLLTGLGAFGAMRLRRKA